MSRKLRQHGRRGRLSTPAETGASPSGPPGRVHPARVFQRSVSGGAASTEGSLQSWSGLGLCRIFKGSVANESYQAFPCVVYGRAVVERGERGGHPPSPRVCCLPLLRSPPGPGRRDARQHRLPAAAAAPGRALRRPAFPAVWA